MMIIDILVNPQSLIKKLAKKPDLKKGLSFFVIWTVIAAAVNALVATLQRNTYAASLGTHAATAVPSMQSVFTNAFISAEANSIVLFAIIGVVVHVFMNAVNAKQKLSKFYALLSYPFAAIAMLGVTIMAISYVLSLFVPTTGMIATFVSLIIGASIITTVVYAFIIYSETAALSYKTNLQTAAISVLLTALTIFAASASQTLGQSLSGLI